MKPKDPFHSHMQRIVIPWAEAGEAGMNRAKAYLLSRGFEAVPTMHGIWEARRGSVWRNLVTFDVKKIRLTGRVYRKGDFLVIKFFICTFMQQFTDAEVEYFELEMAECASIATKNEPLPPGAWEEHNDSKSFNTKGFLCGLGWSIFVAVIIGLVIRLVGTYGLDRAPEPWPVPNQTAAAPAEFSTVEVYLVPFDGFPEPLANELANWLSKDLNLNVKCTPAAACDFAQPNLLRDQYVADSFYQGMAAIAARLPERSRDTAVIFLTEKDIYLANTNLRFVFSVHWDKHLSLVATGRYAPIHRETPPNNRLFNERTLKLLKRTIGVQFYGYPRSSNPESLMYSPLMSIPDLDNLDIQQW